MNENTGVSLNFQSPNISTVVYAVQNDKLSRHIVAQLRDGSAPWTPPAGALAAIRYLKPDGTGGFYDVDENNDPAISVSGSVATLTLAEQCTTVPGDVYMQLNFYGTDGSKLTTFAWILRVQKSVLADATIVSSDYYNVLTEAVAQVAADRAAVEAIAESITLPWPIESGGTDATSARAARANLGIGSAEQNVSIGETSLSERFASIGITVVNSNNSLNGHRLLLFLTNSGFVLYDNTAGTTIKNVAFPLSIANGGTGADNAADALSNLGFASGTGYCKLADGTMIQYGVKTGLSFSNENLIQGTVDLAQNFYDTNYYITANTFSTSVNNYVFRVGVYPSTKGQFSFSMASNEAITINNRGFQWIAVGRWK